MMSPNALKLSGYLGYDNAHDGRVSRYVKYKTKRAANKAEIALTRRKIKKLYNKIEANEVTANSAARNAHLLSQGAIKKLVASGHLKNPYQSLKGILKAHPTSINHVRDSSYTAQYVPYPSVFKHYKSITRPEGTKVVFDRDIKEAMRSVPNSIIYDKDNFANMLKRRVKRTDEQDALRRAVQEGIHTRLGKINPLYQINHKSVSPSIPMNDVANFYRTGGNATRGALQNGTPATKTLRQEVKLHNGTNEWDYFNKVFDKAKSEGRQVKMSYLKNKAAKLNKVPKVKVINLENIKASENKITAFTPMHALKKAGSFGLKVLAPIGAASEGYNAGRDRFKEGSGKPKELAKTAAASGLVMGGFGAGLGASSFLGTNYIDNKKILKAKGAKERISKLKKRNNIGLFGNTSKLSKKDSKLLDKYKGIIKDTSKHKWAMKRKAFKNNLLWNTAIIGGSAALGKGVSYLNKKRKEAPQNNIKSFEIQSGFLHGPSKEVDFVIKAMPGKGLTAYDFEDAVHRIPDFKRVLDVKSLPNGDKHVHVLVAKDSDVTKVLKQVGNMIGGSIISVGVGMLAARYFHRNPL